MIVSYDTIIHNLYSYLLKDLIMNEIKNLTEKDKNTDIYLGIGEWQVKRIKTAIQEADDMKFVTFDQISKEIEKWQE